MRGTDLRIVFMGTPDFAVASLNELVTNGYNVVGVITAPDRPAGRGKKLVEPAVKKYAFENNLKILQPEKLKNAQFLAELQAMQADLQVIVAFRMLPEVVWDMPRLGTFNLHASLLPQYRGAAPINWAIINGETKTGVTTFLIDQKIDTGNILYSEETEIGEKETVGDVHDRLMKIGAKLVTKTVDALAAGNVTPVAQSQLMQEAGIKNAPKIFKEDCKIDWSLDCESVRNLIRGLSPYPAAWTQLEHLNEGVIQSAKIYSANRADGAATKPGTIKSDGKTYLKVACKNGWLEITDLQIAGKKRLNVENFLRGFPFINDYMFK